MKPVLFTIGSFAIRSYGLMIALGIFAGLALTSYLNRSNPKRVELILDFATWAIPGALIGARLWEVAFSWDYYGRNLLEIPAVWHGGLSIQGAIAGGILTLVLFSRLRKINFWEMADELSVGLILGQAIGRIGCFLNGDAYGKPTGFAWGAIYQPGTPAYDVFGARPLWPAELMEAVWDLLVLTILLLYRPKQLKPGHAFALYLMSYSFGRFVLEFLRADSLTLLGQLKVAQLTAIATITVGFAIWCVSSRSRAQENMPNQVG